MKEGVHMRSVMILELLSSHWTDFAVFGVHRLPCFIMSFKSLRQILVYLSYLHTWLGAHMDIPRNSHRPTMGEERKDDRNKRSRNEKARGIKCKPLLALGPREHIPIEQDKGHFNGPQLDHISQSKEIYKLSSPTS